MREFLLMRHGEAESHADGGDDARALTARGEAVVASMAAALVGLDLRPDAIDHSPLTRADQTAALVAAATGAPTRVEPAYALGTSVAAALRALRASTAQRLLVVSHMPVLPMLCEALCGARVDFGTAAVAHLVWVSPTSAALLGLFPSERLARVRAGW